MDELGVIGLVAGLWIALAQPASAGAGLSSSNAYPSRLGWLLVGLSGVLLLTGSLAPPSTASDPTSVSRTCVGTSCVGSVQGVAYQTPAHRTVDMSGATGITGATGMAG